MLHRIAKLPTKHCAITLATLITLAAPTVSAQAAKTDNTAAQSVVELIAERLQLWQNEGRDDRVDQLLQQLARSNPNHPLLLETRAQLALQQGDNAQFQQLLNRLEQVAPNAPETARLQELANLTEQQRKALASARLYSLSQRYDEAYQAYRSVFPEAPLNRALAMDYWRSASQARHHEEALAGLRQLRQQYPDSVNVELELYSAQLRANQLSKASAERVEALIGNPRFSANARQLWLRYINAERPVQSYQLTALKHYLSDYPQDLEAKSLLRNLQQQRQVEIARAAIPQPQPAQRQAAAEPAAPAAPSPWEIYDAAKQDIANGDSAQAKQRFEQLLQKTPTTDARFAYALVLSQLDQRQAALTQLAQIPSAQKTDNIKDLQQRLQLNQALADNDQDYLLKHWDELDAYNASRVLSALTETLNNAQQAQQTPQLSQAQVEQKLKAYANDIDLLMASSDYLQAIGADASAFALNQQGLANGNDGQSPWVPTATDDWRRNRLRSQALDYIKANEAVLTIAYDYQSRDSTPGVSSLTAQTLLFDLRVPSKDLLGLGSGEWFIKIDPTRADAGSADLTDDFLRQRFGTGLLCNNDCDLSPRPQNDQGVALGLGFTTSNWSADIGRSPIGFKRSTWTGGLSYSSDFGELGWSLGVERRILSSSLLNFAAIDDFRTGKTWGRVTQNGINLSASWDQGGAFGWWGSAGYDKYLGVNTADNSRWYAYSGVYWRAYNTEPFAVDVGLTALTWGFADDSSEATFGQGNYYSPQSYASLSLPITIYGRWQRFSYLLRVSVGGSKTSDDDALFFPNDPALQQQAVDAQGTTFVEPVFTGGDSNGFSRSINAAIEYRLTRHWYIGLSANLQRAELYTPNNGMIYLRYQFGGYSLPPRRPPEPPVRYVDF
ncbi:cellulose biosynthesis protein BcsC [Idiomarina tyrosinivorans]|nr:cellulose biosynthesis protein BcsC [Idiomarina tyrosinivorans]